MLELIYLLVGLLVGCGIIYLIMRSRESALKDRLGMTEKLIEEQKVQFQQRIGEQQEYSQQRLSEQQEQFQLRLSEMQERQEQLKRTQEQQFQQQLTLIKEQMNTASERILKERAQELSTTNKEQLSNILTPLQENIVRMQKEAEQMRRDHTVSLERLDASIRSNWEREKAMGLQTERLAQALTGENKVQGNFGELRLRQILEDMGLEEGVQFEEQTVMRDENGKIIQPEDGKRMIPDVVLHFPEGRDVVIDSKMSFTAFVDYQNADTEEERADALRRHILSVRSHVRELAQKQYYKYTRQNAAKLDFVLMYVFQESALQLALINDARLWKDAYDQGVVISGSQNLYMTLRVLEMTWKQVRQVENQENIMKCANQLVERVQNFAERFAKVDEMLQKTRKSFDDLHTVTADSGQSITTAARHLLKYGAQENKKKRTLQETTPKEIE